MALPLGRTTTLPDLARFFHLLADETRMLIVRLLALSDLRASEIGEAVRLPSNAVSYHLKQLRSLGLLRDHRSTADARDVYYHLDLDRLLLLYATGGESLFPGMTVMPDDHAPDAQAAESASARPLRVLFLCTHNSARSQLAEGILRRMGGDQVETFSAGSEPTEVDPDAIVVLREWGIDPAPHHAKSLATFAGEHFDYIITVCDRVRDVCPVFPGDPTQIHWSLADPEAIDDPDRRRQLLHTLALELQTRIRYLLQLPHPATGMRLQPPH